jgi:hypothetical protein
MDISVLDIVLINITTYLLGVGSGLLFCCKYKDRITRSRSMDNISRYNNNPTIYPPENTATVVAASAPPPSQNSVKLTIE